LWLAVFPGVSQPDIGPQVQIDTLKPYVAPLDSHSPLTQPPPPLGIPAQCGQVLAVFHLGQRRLSGDRGLAHIRGGSLQFVMGYARLILNQLPGVLGGLGVCLGQYVVQPRGTLGYLLGVQLHLCHGVAQVDRLALQ